MRLIRLVTVRWNNFHWWSDYRDKIWQVVRECQKIENRWLKSAVVATLFRYGTNCRKCGQAVLKCCIHVRVSKAFQQRTCKLL